MTKALEKADIHFDSLKKLHGWNYSFISFGSEEEAKRAKLSLESQKIKGFQFELEKARHDNRKRKIVACLQRFDENMDTAKKFSSAKQDTDTEIKKKAADVVAPWRHYSYPEQLRKKRSAILDVLARVTSSLKLVTVRIAPNSLLPVFIEIGIWIVDLVEKFTKEAMLYSREHSGNARRRRSETVLSK